MLLICISIHVLPEHRCDKAGCGSVIVLDGNMKNHRGVCLATHAGFAEYDGLPGAIQTGCPNTPAHRSQFCSLHKPEISKKQNTPSEILMIIGKRTTQQGVSYEVSINECSSQVL